MTADRAAMFDLLEETVRYLYVTKNRNAAWRLQRMFSRRTDYLAPLSKIAAVLSDPMGF
jgi:hypothetical protein